MAQKGKTKKQQLRQKKWLPIAGIIFVGLIGVALVTTIYARGPKVKTSYAATPVTTSLDFSLYATHPYASKAGFPAGSSGCTTTSSSSGAVIGIGGDSSDGDFCPVGQTLTDMGVTASGELIAGYGDYDKNVDSWGVPEGRVGVVPLNLKTGSWGSITPAGSEELGVVREINGYLYLPTTDPSSTLGGKSGYVTNEGGTWHKVVDGQNAEHTFDIASSNGSDLFLMGSKGGYTATAWRSTDRGKTWQVATTADSSDNSKNGYERYYWGASMGEGSLMVSARNTTPLSKPQTFNGTSWSNTGKSPLCYVTGAKYVVSFDGKVVCAWYGSYQYPGTNQTVSSPCGYRTICTVDSRGRASALQYTTSSSYSRATDFYVSDGYLYVLNGNGEIYRTESLTSTWQYLGKFDTAANESLVSTLAVYNDYIYVGGSSGKIFKASIPIAQITQS